MSGSPIPITAYRVDASATNIPASTAATVTLDASLREDCTEIDVNTNSTASFGLYYGPAGSEKLAMWLPSAAELKINTRQLNLSKGMRLSLRASGTAAIVTGETLINLFK